MKGGCAQPPHAAQREVEHICVVKKSLRSALNPALTPQQEARFLGLVDQYSELASKLCRRASLIFLYFVVKRQEQQDAEEDVQKRLSPLAFEDAKAFKDAYWRQWLRIGLSEWGCPMPAPEVAPYYEEVKPLVAQSVAELLRSPSTAGKAEDDGEEDKGATTKEAEDGEVAGIPYAFDQVLGHAATMFRTAVLNNMTAFFWPKLRRLCKHVVRAAMTPGGQDDEEDDTEEELRLAPAKDPKPSAWTLLTAIRRDKVPTSWPPALRQFVLEARKQLGVPNHLVLYDDHPFTHAQRFAFSWWLQGQLAEMEQRRNRLSPVFQVARQHVRLDTTTLYRLAHYCLTPEAPALPAAPLRAAFADDAQHLAALKEHKEQVQALQRSESYQAAVREYEEELRKLTAVCPPYRSIKRAMYGDHPDERMLKEVPAVGSKPPGMSAAAWKEERLRRKAAKEEAQLHNRQTKQSQEYQDAIKAYQLRCSSPAALLQKHDPKPKREDADSDQAYEAMLQAHKERCKAVQAANAATKQTDAYKQQADCYREYEQRVRAGAQLLFRPFRDKSPKAGWEPCMSVATDGVSVSIGYFRMEAASAGGAVVGSAKEKKALAKAAAKARVDNKKQKLQQAGGGELEHSLEDEFVDYDPGAMTSTLTEDTLVVGIDPGRVQIVTALCVDAQGKKHVWRLSNGQYYNDSGLRTLERRQRKRYKPLQPAFQALADSQGMLRAKDSMEVRKYMEAAALVEESWWQVALVKAESRARLRRYVGKRSVLDRFFARLLKEAQALAQNKQVVIAYGSAVDAMPSTGRGEVAAPVGDAYRACQRACVVHAKGARVTPEDESHTTSTCWDSKQRYRSVYKGYVGPEGKAEFFGHYAMRVAPVANPEHVEALKAAVQRAKERARVRRGGKLGVTVSLKEGELEEAARQKREQGTGDTEEQEKKTRYMVVRGLRYCPIRRMYFDRDESSARTIAFLHYLRLQGAQRPTLFRKQQAVPSGAAW